MSAPGAPVEEPSLPALLAYSAPSVALALLTLGLVIYIPAFYATEAGMPLTVVGLVFMVARLWDAIIDPMIGALSDRTRSRWGQRKPWLAIATPLLMLFTYALMRPFETSMLYLLFAIFGFYLFWTAVQIPYIAWGSELSSSYAGRNRIAGFREGAQFLGILLATGVPTLLFQGSTPTLAQILGVFTWCGILVLAVAVPMALLVAPTEQVTGEAPVPLRRMFGLAFSNRLLLRYLSAHLLIWLAVHVYNAVVLFLVVHRMGIPEGRFLELVFAEYVAATVAAPLTVRLANRIGKHRTLALSLAGLSATFLAMSAVGYGSYAQAMTVFVVLGVFIAPCWILPASIVTDTADYGALQTGERPIGVYMALYNLATKIALAVGVGIALPLLQVLGFNPNAYTPEQAVSLNIAGLYLPILLCAGGFALLWGFPLDRRRHDLIRRRLQGRAIPAMAD